MRAGFPQGAARRDERLGASGEPNRRGVCESAQILRNALMQRSPLLRTVTGLLALASAVAVPAAAHARLQCVAYARQASAVQLSGNARDWWGHAEGVYARGNAPRKGAVLAFRATHAMPMGHVAVVSKVIDERHVLISHANWSRPGAVEKGVMAVDVSDAGDWSQVRVWYGPTASLGLRPSPAFGFIYPATETASKASDSDTDAG
jgi:surface antigen